METNKIYEQFKEVADHSYRSVIKFWTIHEDKIMALPNDKYFDILHEYCDALFEMGRYDSFIEVATHVIECSFEYNIAHWKGKDVLEVFLFRKAAAHYQLYQTDKAFKNLKQLLALHPHKREAHLLLEKCMSRKSADKTVWWKKLTVVSMLSAAFIVAIELIVVARYYPEYKFEAEMLRTFLFIFGLLAWIVGESLQRLMIKQKSKSFIKKVSL